jgi:hypothetical protein
VGKSSYDELEFLALNVDSVRRSQVNVDFFLGFSFRESRRSRASGLRILASDLEVRPLTRKNFSRVFLGV